MSLRTLTTITKCCCCGQLIPPRIPWTGRQLQIWNLVVASYYPPTNSDLANAIWADDPDGGPDDAIGVVWTTIHSMNRKLARAGILVRISGKHNGHNGYRLEATTPAYSAMMSKIPVRKRKAA